MFQTKISKRLELWSGTQAKGPMVLPEFKMNHRYYSTHAYYKDFEPLRKSEFLWVDNDDKPSKTETKTETKTSKAYDYITALIEEYKLNGKVINYSG